MLSFLGTVQQLVLPINLFNEFNGNDPKYSKRPIWANSVDPDHNTVSPAYAGISVGPRPVIFEQDQLISI